eukprot:GEMP01049249.1.p1 GENE.GEMP01049249.1~~GEMP01049249.1.p1  ORF type:complete len:267 (+),score=59.83 GEMP01049249.1:81-881(+)
MATGVIPHFTTEEYTQKNVFLKDRDYAQALDCLVKGVCDTLLFRSGSNYDEQKVFLGQRKVQPQPDWWFIGGRMKCGETPKESSVRNIFRETGIRPKVDELTLINVYSFSFGFREQEPKDNGTCDVSVVHAFELPAGVEPKLDAAEYRSGMWFNASDVMANARFHPAIRQAIADYRMRCIQEQLHKSIVNNDASAIVTHAQQMRPWLAERNVHTEVRFKNEEYSYIKGGEVEQLSTVPACKMKHDFVPLVSVFLLGIATGMILRRR